MGDMPRIGAFVLDTLTTGMYRNPLDTLREFVQNSADSIRRAERGGILFAGAGRIDICVDPGARSVTVRDNGVGIPAAHAYGRLTDVGMSDKAIETDAGFRGIGRLAGIAYCKTLRFRTSAPEEDVATTVEFDCEALRAAASPTMRKVEELPNIMGRYSSSSVDPATTQDHFFEVTMEGLQESESASKFLESRPVELYLREVAPIAFDAHRFVFATRVAEWVNQHHLPMPVVTVVLQDPVMERQLFKAYKTHYKTHKSRAGQYDVHVDDVCFYPESPTQDSPYWIWYSKTQLLGMLDDPAVAGLRLRQNNMQLGDPEAVAQLFREVAESNGRFNAYYLGEIHVLSPEAIPNARRDGFEDNGSWPAIKRELVSFVRERCEEVRSTSKARNRPVPKILASSSAVIQAATKRLAAGVVSDRQRESLLNRIDKQTGLIERALQARSDPHELDQLRPVAGQLQKLRERLADARHPAPGALSSALSHKQRRLIMEILWLLSETLSEEEYHKAETAILGRFGGSGAHQ